MNYKTQLNGWAIEMVIKAKEAGFEMGDKFDDLIETTKKLIEYSFNPDKEFVDCISGITTYLKSSPDALEKVNQLQGELGCIQEDIERQNALRQSANGEYKQVEKH